MSTLEATADEHFVGLGSNAVERLPGEWVRRRQRAVNGLVLALLVGVQFAWLAVLGYAAYIFMA